MRTVHVVTHPEATHHVDRVVGGWHDSDLTPAGVRAAGAIASALRSAIPAGARPEVITSDLTRTRRTADAVAEALGVRPMVDRRLRELSYGEAGGRPKAWLDERFVAPPADGNRLDHDCGIRGAETIRTLATRVYTAVDELLARPREHQVVVTHGFAMTFVVARWIGMPVESVGRVLFSVPAGSITTLREDDLFHDRALISLGDTTHLT